MMTPPPTVQALLRHSGIDAVDARVLLMHVLAVNRAWLLGHGDDVVSDAAARAFAALAARRQVGEPVAYLTGRREFYGLDFDVSPAVLIPRPETELLVDLALERLPSAGAVLDLGAGSGAIAVSIGQQRPDANVTAIDISPAALEVARRNAAQHAPKLRLLQSDWYAALAPDEHFDVIVSNPPYIVAGDAHLDQGDLRFEPLAALTDHGDGLGHIRRIVSGAGDHLRAGGWLLFEHGYDQAAACRNLLAAGGWRQVQSWQDLAGIERVSGGVWGG